MTGYIWIIRAYAEAVHDRQLAEHGGGTGLRDENALESALARPYVLQDLGPQRALGQREPAAALVVAAPPAHAVEPQETQLTHVHDSRHLGQDVAEDRASASTPAGDVQHRQ